VGTSRGIEAVSSKEVLFGREEGWVGLDLELQAVNKRNKAIKNIILLIIVWL
jgi:hypothetical protein